MFGFVTKREIGWVKISLPEGMVAPCVMCGDEVTRGIVAVSDRDRAGKPGFRLMCRNCYDDVMASSSESELVERREARKRLRLT